MNPIRNCHRLLNKLCWTVEQRDIFASGITQPRPHMSICATPGFVIVFHSKHFSCYFTAQSMSIICLTSTKMLFLLIPCVKVAQYFFFLQRIITKKPLLSGKSESLCSPMPVFHKMHLRLLCGPWLNVTTRLASILLTSLRAWRRVSTCRWHAGNGSWFVFSCVPWPGIARASASQLEPRVCQGRANKWPVWTKGLLHLQTLHRMI